MLTRDLVRGVFLGGAVGDALGAGVEFDSLATIRHRYGARGVRDLPAGGATITDDTQMTLFTAEGLIRARQGGDTELQRAAVPVQSAYLRWLDTQREGARSEAARAALAPAARGWLVDEPVMRHRRAPGNTCLSGLRSPQMGTRVHRINDSKGCGGVMRIAPVALVASRPFALAADCAALTHGHPSGFLASGAFAVVLAECLRGVPLRDAIAIARGQMASDSEAAEVLSFIDRALATAAEGPPSPEALETLGGGWVAEEALAITLYCALAEEDPTEALLLSVNHGGDSDSTGSMVGQLLGAIHGVSAVPPKWIERLDARDVIERLAEDFALRFVDDIDLPRAFYPTV